MMGDWRMDEKGGLQLVSGGKYCVAFFARVFDRSMAFGLSVVRGLCAFCCGVLALL